MRQPCAPPPKAKIPVPRCCEAITFIQERLSMDITIRRNELCVIGLPRCDFVFSSTRTCFIGYGFQESALEMNILKHVLSERGIEPIEAGGALAPAQNAFCAKICSKIITSQFCIILLNNETH